MNQQTARLTLAGGKMLIFAWHERSQTLSIELWQPGHEGKNCLFLESTTILRPDETLEDLTMTFLGLHRAIRTRVLSFSESKNAAR